MSTASWQAVGTGELSSAWGIILSEVSGLMCCVSSNKLQGKEGLVCRLGGA